MRSYYLAVRCAAVLGHTKARRYLTYQNLPAGGTYKGKKKTIWIHAASAGEGNQALPLIPHLRRTFKARIIITFFSPSGYDFHKGNPNFDEVLMLPPDIGNNAVRFIDEQEPFMALFIRNELWLNYLQVLSGKDIPVFLVNTPEHLLSKSSFLLRNYISKCLRHFTLLFPTVTLHSGWKNLSPVCGDTKWEAAAAHLGSIDEKISSFCGNSVSIIIGSSWQKEESILRKWMDDHPGNANLIIAPHEVDENRIVEIRNLFPHSVLYSEMSEENDPANDVLVIDEYGLLRTAYQYADIAIVGGGFGKGIHNILEPAAAGVPALFGPQHRKFPEALFLIERGLAFATDEPGMASKLTQLVGDRSGRQQISTALNEHFAAQKGFSEKVVIAIESVLNP